MNRRLLVACALALLPPGLRRRLGCLLLGWKVDPTAHIGYSVISARRVEIGPGVRIGSLNMIKGLEELVLGPQVRIDRSNWISGPPLETGLFASSRNRHPALIMAEGAAILNKHHIDCSHTVTFGRHAVLGGISSTLLTHGLNLVRDRGEARPVTFGDYVTVMTGSTILAGVRIAPYSIVAAGSVVTTPLTKTHTLYRGNPAEAVRDLPESLGYFHRGETS